MVNVFDHAWLSGLFRDDETAAFWSAKAQLSHMIAFEAAWSRAGHLAALWSETDGALAADAINAANIAPEDLRDGTAQDGVCVPALVGLLKQAAGDTAVHKGATSQDLIDTAMVLSLVQTLDLFTQRLVSLITTLKTVEAKHGGAEMMGRTRMQAAVPISVKDRLQTWHMPLAAHVERLQSCKDNVAYVQIGGAAGNRAALGDKADEVNAAVAAELCLKAAPRSWHAMRDGIAEAASVLSLISGTLGKMGQDICLMAQQGIGEVRLAGGGASSAMPHKQNPVQAELLVTLARFNSVQLAGMHQALIHEQERSGAAWSLEWMILPQMAAATGQSLQLAAKLAGSIEQIGTA